MFRAPSQAWIRIYRATWEIEVLEPLRIDLMLAESTDIPPDCSVFRTTENQMIQNVKNPNMHGRKGGGKKKQRTRHCNKLIEG